MSKCRLEVLPIAGPLPLANIFSALPAPRDATSAAITIDVFVSIRRYTRAASSSLIQPRRIRDGKTRPISRDRASISATPEAKVKVEIREVNLTRLGYWIGRLACPCGMPRTRRSDGEQNSFALMRHSRCFASAWSPGEFTVHSFKMCGILLQPRGEYHRSMLDEGSKFLLSLILW